MKLHSPILWLLYSLRGVSDTPAGRRRLIWFLTVSLVVVGATVAGLTYKVFQPVVNARVVEAPAPYFQPPAYDYGPWHSAAVQHASRTKPFESAAVETLRGICGKSRFKKDEDPEALVKIGDPVALVLNWMLTEGKAASAEAMDWESYPFILCNHHDTRAAIYAHLAAEGQPLTEEQLHGKYISPKDLRDSPGVEKLLAEAHKVREEDPEKASQNLSPTQAKAEEVVNRLTEWDHLCGRVGTRLKTKVVIGRNLYAPESAARVEERTTFHPDPLFWVMLDAVPGAQWFSVMQARAVLNDPGKWADMMRGRIVQTPQYYISPDQQADLRDFQQKIRLRQATPVVEELAAQVRNRKDELFDRFSKAFPSESIDLQKAPLEEYFSHLSVRQFNDLKQWVSKASKDGRVKTADFVGFLRDLFNDEDNRRIEELKRRVTKAQQIRNYNADDLEFRMMHLDYLELKYPNLYRDSLAWQPAPVEQCRRVVLTFDKLKQAFRGGDPAAFAAATDEFFRTVREVSDRSLIAGYAKSDNEQLRDAYDAFQASLTDPERAKQLQAKATAYTAAEVALLEAQKTNDAQAQQSAQEKRERARDEYLAAVAYSPQLTEANDRFQAALASAGRADQRYPGSDVLGLEMTFNKVQPFQWAWVLMVPAMLFFAVSYFTGGRYSYLAGYLFFFLSLGFQVFGFYARVAISGRPPVSNMYETVIWVSFMSGIFALALELVYRKRFIVLAGSMVSTIGLVLADQLPVALDPKISPLVPVLRSNFWLIIHVLTIVSSYAGGTLAWGLGNLMLAMLAFGTPKRETLKTLSTFTYRAMQIAVLLLAAGTFLGGWWAAYSWGRFWGWDPKETWALIALVCYVIPLHARYVGWVKDFGLAVSAVVCYSAIVMCWYGVNFVLGAGLHSYGFGGGGPWWVFWAGMLNILWVVVASLLYQWKLDRAEAAKAAGDGPPPTMQLAGV